MQINTGDPRTDIGSYMMRHMMTFIAQAGVLLTVAVAWNQLGLPWIATTNDVVETREMAKEMTKETRNMTRSMVSGITHRLDNIALLVFYDKKTSILAKIENNESRLAEAANKAPYKQVRDHLNEKLRAIDQSIAETERARHGSSL